jgi:hypothetical protein
MFALFEFDFGAKPEMAVIGPLLFLIFAVLTFLLVREICCWY